MSSSCPVAPRPRRKLTRRAGVDSHEVSLEKQTATVVTSLPYETVLTKIAKTGKKVNSATADGVEQSVEVPAAA
jgi:copper chaperone